MGLRELADVVENWTQWTQVPLCATGQLGDRDKTSLFADEYSASHSPLVKRTLEGVMFHPPYLLTWSTAGEGGKPTGNAALH